MRWGNYPGLSWWAQYNYKVPCKREEEGQSQRRKCGDAGPLAKECGQLLEAEKGKETDFALEPLKASPASKIIKE